MFAWFRGAAGPAQAGPDACCWPDRAVGLKASALWTIGLLSALFVLLAWPLGKWKQVVPDGFSLSVESPSDEVSEELRSGLDIGAFFLASGTHLDALQFYVESWSADLPYVMALLYEVDESGRPEILAKEFMQSPAQVPGWVRIPADVDTVPGRQYYVTLTAVGAYQGTGGGSFRAGLAAPDEESGSLQAAIYRRYETAENGEAVRGTEADSVIDGYLLCLHLVYREKLTAGQGLLLLLCCAAGAALLFAGVHLFFRRFPDRNRQTTPRRVLRAVLTPLTVAAAAVLQAAIWPGKLFDHRAADNLLYSVGNILTAVVIFYALWHRPPESEGKSVRRAGKYGRERSGSAGAVTTSSAASADACCADADIADGCSAHPLGACCADADAEGRGSGAVRPAVVIMTALVFQFACDYMNALADIGHTVAERRMAAAFLLMLLASYPLRRLCRRGMGVWLAGAGTAALVWYGIQRAAGDAEEAVLERQALRAGLLVLVLLIPVLWLLAEDLRRWIAERSRKIGENPRLCVWYAAALLAFFAALCIRRNTRWWPVALVFFFLLFYLRYYFRRDRGSWMEELSLGVCLQFALMVGYCLLHRLFLSFIFTRFAMNFHTVTITAEYLTVVEAVAVSRLLSALGRSEGRRAAERLALCWKELLLFSVSSVYLLFTMSRTGAAAVAVMIAVLLPVWSFAGRKGGTGGASAEVVRAPGGAHEDRGRTGEQPGLQAGSPGARTGAFRASARLFGAICVMLLSVALAFPAVFTMQRVISTVNGEPRQFSIEKYPDAVLRGRHWDSMYYMCIERFAQVFGSKMLGLPEGGYDYYEGREIPVEERVGPDLNEGYLGMLPPGDSRPLLPAGPERPGREAVRARAVRLLASAAALEGSGDVEIAEGSAAKALSSDTGENGSAAASASDAGGTVESAQAEGETESDYSNGRTTIWRCYMRELNAAGHDTMNVVLPDGEEAVHAHNTFLQAAYDHGVPVGILFAAVLILTFIRSALYYSSGRAAGSRSALLPMAAAVGFVMAGMVEWVFQFSNPLTLLLLMASAPLLLRDGQSET